MTTSTTRRHFTRAAALTGAVTIIASAAIGWNAFSASAAFPGTAYETEFEIDANTADDGGQDWDTAPGDAPNLQNPPFRTPDDCGNLTEDQIVPGTKIDDFLLEQPPVNEGNVNTKSDLCAVYATWELVFVPTADQSDDPQAGQYQFILYGGWIRPLTNGEIDVLFPLLGDEPGSKTDDLIISYDFDDSNQATEVEALLWNGETWVAHALPAGSFEAQTTTDETSLPDPSNPDDLLTFGEFALNLTTSEILPENGPCVSFSTGDPMTRTGNSPTATLEDIVDAEPITLTNCSSLKVTKVTQPATPATPQDFDFSVDQLDGAIIQSPDETALTDTLTVPGNHTVTIDELLISPDYVVTETDLPDGWAQVSLICESFDPLTGEPVTRALFSEGGAGPDTSFPLAPGVVAECEIVNVGPPTVSVTKDVEGPSTDWEFEFTITPVPAGETATKTATAASPTVTWQLEAGVEYTITEGDVDGFISGDISCVDNGDTFTPEPGEQVECTVTNTQLVDLEVETTATASLDRTVSWSLDKSVAPTSHTGTAGGDAGSSTWTVVATKTVTLGNFGVSGTVTVINNNDIAVPFTIAQSLDDGTDVSVNCQSQSVPANGTVECTFTATPTADTATETAALVTPSTAGLDAVTATAEVDFVANDIGDDTVTVDDDRETEGQFPVNISQSTTFNYAETFPCSETPSDYTNFTQQRTETNTATLTGESTNLSDSAAANITCTLPPASVDVTKTVAGNAATWSFDFTISPPVAGETATKSATNSAPTIGWDGLVPGTTYTITETNVAGFITGTLTCTDGTNGAGTSTFTPEPGEAVACAITNDVVQQQAPPIADIAVVKTATPTIVTPGGNVTWTLTARNNGPDAADNASIVDNLPASLTLVSFTSPAGWDCSGTVTGNPGKLSCTKPTMGVNESATFTLSTTVAASAAGQTINNIAVVTTSTSETSTSNNQDAEPISVQVAVLPPTGGYVWNRVAIAAGLVLAGLALAAIDRRRRIIS